MRICILTRKPRESFLDIVFLKGAVKDLLKKILRRSRGPSSVVESLKRGRRFMEDLSVEINPSYKQIVMCDIIHVVSDLDALKFAFKLKQNNLVKKLVAGPNLVLHPLENNKILCNDLIDVILLPSNWTKDLYVKMEPNLAKKIKLWPAGVYTPEGTCYKSKDKISFLIYKKNAPEDLYQSIVAFLDEKKYDFTTIYYGKYKKAEYLELLRKNTFLIYLQASESQGIALSEAWSYNTPTFVWDSGIVTYGDIGSFSYKNVSCPYLSEESGMTFKDIEDFRDKFYEFIAADFTPYNYAKLNLSDQKSMQIYESILRNI